MQRVNFKESRNNPRKKKEKKIVKEEEEGEVQKSVSGGALMRGAATPRRSPSTRISWLFSKYAGFPLLLVPPTVTQEARAPRSTWSPGSGGPPELACPTCNPPHACFWHETFVRLLFIHVCNSCVQQLLVSIFFFLQFILFPFPRMNLAWTCLFKRVWFFTGV